MSEDADLQARIAHLAGRINQHKTQSSSPETATGVLQPRQCKSQRWPVGSGPRLGSANCFVVQHNQRWPPQRGTPYGAPRGRGWNSRQAPHRNKTLVLNQPVATSADANENGAPAGWITRNDRHMQLINNNIYEQQAQERAQAIAVTKRKKQLERDQREKSAVMNQARTIPGNPHHSNPAKANSTAHHINVHGIDFIVADGGSKLIRTSKEEFGSTTTPKHVPVGGVMFLRSRNGNLYRAGLVKSKRREGVQKRAELCQRFSTTGTCAKGPQCRFIHDPAKVAICKDFLATGKCHAGESCDLSHDPTPERVPACLHFLRGNCTNPSCRYAHVRVNPGSPVCRAFAILGYCDKGSACTERHVHECPDYANKGLCRNKKCRLPHVDRAGQLRKAAATMQSPEGADPSSSDIDSDDEFAYDSDDVDSDEFEEESFVRHGSTSGRSDLSQQRDYVAF